jgi:glucose/arabinose dehydrogenase
MRSRGRLAVATAAVLAVGPAVPTAAPGTAAAPAPALTVETVHEGLDHPWDLAFLPDGTGAATPDFLVTERSGAVNLSLDGTLHELAVPEDAVARGEGGMMGVAVDPDFTANRRVYTCFLSDRSGGLDVRIARWTLDAGGTASPVLSGREDILTGLPVNRSGEEGRHSGCRPRFGPDGYLWVGTGDAATGTNPQDPASLGGKVLRITTDGAGAPGNAGEPFRPEVLTYGHRNVQGLAFDAEGRAYAVEHGTDRDDELNRLEPGANYGWDPGSGYDESRPMTDLEAFPDARPAVWSSGDPTIAPSGGTFLSGPAWGAWDGALVMAVLKGRELRVLALDGGRTAVAEQWTGVEDQGRLRTAVQGPDGNLYVATDADDGRILRITPAPATPPSSGGPAGDAAGDPSGG